MNDKWPAAPGAAGARDPEASSAANDPALLSGWAVKLEFVGANLQVQPTGQEPTEAVVSYFKGPQEAWRTGLPTYRSVIYRELWPGIDLVYRGTTGKLKYEFVVKPGADPGQIRLAYRGANALRVDESGQLLVSTPLGELVDGTPLAWQEQDGRRTTVDMRYQLEPKAAGLMTDRAMARRRMVFRSEPMIGRARWCSTRCCWSTAATSAAATMTTGTASRWILRATLTSQVPRLLWISP